MVAPSKNVPAPRFFSLFFLAYLFLANVLSSWWRYALQQVFLSTSSVFKYLPLCRLRMNLVALPPVEIVQERCWYRVGACAPALLSAPPPPIVGEPHLQRGRGSLEVKTLGGRRPETPMLLLVATRGVRRLRGSSGPYLPVHLLPRHLFRRAQ